MKIHMKVSYKNKKSGECRHFLWLVSTNLGQPPFETCIQVDEVPAIELKPGKSDPYMRVTTTSQGSDPDAPTLHDFFMRGEFNTGMWELQVNRKPVITAPDIPLPEVSEVLPPRAGRGLLDSAASRLKRK